MPRVLVGNHLLIGSEGAYLTALQQAGYDPVFAPQFAQMTEAELLDRLAGCVGSVAGSEPYTAKVLAAHPQLRIISRIGVGYDAVDVAAATARGIPVAVAPRNAEAVGEHTIGLMLALCRMILQQHLDIAAGGWPRQPVRPLRGQTLGIIGLGRTGKQTARRAHALGMNIIASDPVHDDAFAAQFGIQWVTTPELLTQADFVSLHVPLTNDTRHMVNQSFLASMKPTAYLINTSRGNVVDDDALLHALTAQRIAGAALDVMQKEPPPKDHPLRTAPNLIITAHIAGIDRQAIFDMAELAAQTVVRYLRGEWPGEYVVNPESRRDLSQLPSS